MRIAVVGTGSIGKRHIGNLLASGVPACDIVAMDTREDRRQETGSRFGVEVHASFEELLGVDFDAALICSPTSEHIRQSLPLAARGVHLAIEKPLDASLDGIQELQRIVEEKRVQVLVAYCFRFSNHAREFREIVRSQAVGKALYVRGEFSEYLPDWHPYEDYRSFYMAKVGGGGGSLLDQSHVLDIAHWIFGDVASVFAFSGRVSDLEVETDDLAEMQVRFASGLIGTIHQDMFGREHAKTIEVKCSEGNVQWNVYDLSVRVFDARQRTVTVHQTPKDHQIMYMNEIRHFLDLCTGKETTPACTLAEGVHGMQVLEAARRSAQSQRLEAVG